jgi:hypothetical protein
MQYARYTEAQCERACEEGSNLCKLCKKYEEAYMSADPNPKLRMAAVRFHGRKGGPIPAESHIIGSAWAAAQNAKNAERAAKVAGAAAAGGGGGEAKAAAAVAKKAAAVAKVAADEAMKAGEKALKAVSNSEEHAWEMARGRAGMTVSRGANVAQIARAMAAEEKARGAAAAAAEKAHKAAARAVVASERKTRKRSSSAKRAKSRRASPPRIYAAASKGIPAANWMRTPSSPRMSGIRGAPPSPASRSSSALPAGAAAVEPNFADLEAELGAALGGSVLDRNSV